MAPARRGSSKARHRRTRPANKEETKADRILTAATRVLAEEGYAGTTIALVAAEAGVSRGLLHYYFANKEEMLALVVRRFARQNITVLETLVAASRTPAEFARAFTKALRALTRADPGLFGILAEALSMARRNRRMREECKTLHDEFRRVYQHALGRWATGSRLRSGLTPAGLSVVLIALGDGMGLDATAVPGLVEDDATWEALRRTLERQLT